MSKIDGFAVQRLDKNLITVGVARTADDRWRVVERSLTEEPVLPPMSKRDMTRQGARIGCLMADDQVTCVQTPMPRLKRREMERAVSGWIARQDGGAPSDWRYSWRELGPHGKVDNGRELVSITYTAKEQIDEQIARIAAFDIEPSLMLPPSLVLDQFFRLAGPDRDELEVWNLVFLSGGDNFLCVSNRDGMLLTRPLPRDLSDGADAEEYLDRLATEVERSVFFARQSVGSPNVDRVLVCGDPALASQLVDKLSGETDVPSCQWMLADAFDLDAPSPEPGEQLLLAAAALAASNVTVNLAPASRRSWLGHIARRRLMIAATTAVVALVPVVVVGGMLTSKIQQRFLAAANERLAEASVRAEEAATIYDRQRLLRAREDYLAEFSTSRRDLEGVLLQLAAVTPSEILYRDLQVVDHDDRVLLHLTGESTASSVTAAQEAFMTFHAALAANERLRALGEPRQLQIAEEENSGQAHKTVLFSLDYELVVGTTAEEG